MPRKTGQKKTGPGSGAPQKRQAPASAPNPKRTRRTADTDVPEEQNQSRPLTTADIPTIVNAVLQGRNNYPPTTSDELSASDPAQPANDAPGNPTTAVNTGAPASAGQTYSEDTSDFGPVTGRQTLSHLNSITQGYLKEGLAPATRRTYSTGKQRFIAFCTASGKQALPATESALLMFVSHLALNNISHATIKTYLAAVRHMHVIVGMHNSFEEQLTPRLHLALRGIKRTQAILTPCRTRLPITLQIMSGIKDYLSRQPHSHSNIMLWAACCLAFFGFLHVSEFTVPCHGTYDPGTHLSPADILLDNRDNPHLIAVFIKRSKTDPFRKGVRLYLGSTNHPVCPVAGILPYLALRGDRPGPLFLTKDGKGLTRQALSASLDGILEKLQLQPRSYNTHSFRIGAATSAAQANIPDHCIKMLGRWQ